MTNPRKRMTRADWARLHAPPATEEHPTAVKGDTMTPPTSTFNPGPWGFAALVLGALACFLAGGNSAYITIAVILTVLGAILLGWALVTGKTTFLGSQKRE